MFWRLKRVEWSLSASWKQMMTFTHTRGELFLPKLRPIIHKCTLYRGRMMHVINNLCAFIMFEVLETAWSKLQQNLKYSKCLDDIIRYHDSYLEEILDRSLLTAHHEQLNLQVLNANLYFLIHSNLLLPLDPTTATIDFKILYFRRVFDSRCVIFHSEAA